MKTIKTIFLAVVALLASGTSLSQEKNIYMGGHVEMTELPNGGIINKKAPELTEQTWPHEPKIVKIAEGIWSLEGFAHVNCAVIEGETSLIVYDTGNDNEDGRKFLEAVRQVSDKPIKTVMYSHAHYVWGTRPMLEGAEDYMVIGHPNLNDNILESSGLGSSITELAPVLTARAYEQFDIYNPMEGPDAPFVSSPIGSADKEFVAITHPVSNGQEMTVDGIRMQFFTEYHSDTDDCLTVYFPDKGLVLNNLYWPIYGNLYTLRGSLYRDPIPWMEGLRLIRDLQPEYLISTHTHSISGKNETFEAITNYHDGLAYMYDQTLRHILLGDSPDEMRHNINLPEHLASWPNNQETYGELSYYPPNIYNYALGWFDGNTTNLNKVHPELEAKKIIDGFGGRSKVMAAVEEANENQEYAWATQLSDYLYKVYPNDQEVRQLKADALRKMGQLTQASIPRSWYLSQARALENKVEVLHAVMPEVDQILQSAPGTYVNMMRVRLDPAKSSDIDQVMVFEFTDLEGDARFGLHVRRGVAEYLNDPSSHYKSTDVTIKLPRSLFAEYYAGNIDMGELLSSQEVSINVDKELVEKLLSRFDQGAPILKYKKI